MNQYIYNIKQASFFIGRGIKPIDIGVNPKSNKVYVIFNREEISSCWGEWIERNRLILKIDKENLL
ncbi:MAG: hypothetical protein ACRCWM_06370 [Sarcina sp.]